MTLPLSKVEQIRQLQSSGISQRQIAKRVGVSRDTIKRIANGEHCLSRARLRPQQEQVIRGDKLQRCPGCGGMVYMPCYACRLRGNL